jgi:hypothetical protein
MAISPIGPVGASSLPEPTSGDRRSASWTQRTTDAGPSATADVGDRVLLSDTARGIAAAANQAEVELRLSPAELRAMIAPETEASHLTSAQSTDESSSTSEEHHVR